MNVTMSSIISACILGSAMIFAFCPMLRKNSVICRAGPKCVVLILMCMAIRMFIPVEPWFAYNIRMGHILPPVRRVLNYEIVWNRHAARVWDVLMFVWVAGIVCQLGRKLFVYRKLRRVMRLLPSASLGEFLEEKGLREPEEYKDADVRIAVTEFVGAPCLAGIKNSLILLPENDYSGEELSYIIRHEMMHYKNRDVLKKTMTDLLCVAFWWNPAVAYLKQTVFHLIEISNDRTLTEDMPDKAKEAYMACLMNVAVKIRKQEIPFEVSFNKDSVKELKQRLILIREEPRGRNLFGKGLIFLAAALIGLSFSIILEPYTKAPEGIPMTAENTYLIENGGTYDVYVEGRYLFSTDDLAPFPGVTIYENKQEEDKDE